MEYSRFFKQRSTLIPILKPTAVRHELAQYRGKRLFFDPLGGNNGDTLIEMGSRLILREVGAKLVPRPEEAEVVVLNGGGSMTDFWSGAEHVRMYATEHQDKPLVILPSTFYFKSTDFAGLFPTERQEVVLFSRDRTSLAALQELNFPCTTRLLLDHDMAFALSDSEFISQLRDVATDSHILIVERGDAESATARRDNVFGPNWAWKRHIPISLKRRVKWVARTRRWARGAGQQTQFARDALAMVHQAMPNTDPLPVFAADISLKSEFSLSRFGELVTSAAVVVTTRLHVAILAAMLGKPTFLKAGTGSYHKIAAIYEYSLKSYPAITLF